VPQQAASTTTKATLSSTSTYRSDRRGTSAARSPHDGRENRLFRASGRGELAATTTLKRKLRTKTEDQ
jgi:hypothetical protein